MDQRDNASEERAAPSCEPTESTCVDPRDVLILATGSPLTDNQEVLLRHIKPEDIEEEVPTYRAFFPFPKDDNELSVDRSAIFSAAESFHNFTVVRKFSSIAVYGVDVGECKTQKASPKSAPLADDKAHAVIDFRPGLPVDSPGKPVSKSAVVKKQKDIAKELRQAAVKRGQLHPPTA